MKNPDPDKIYFCVDIEKERTGYYFNNAPGKIPERSMNKVLTINLISYNEIIENDNTYCSGEMDMNEFFDKLKNSRIKPDTFIGLFLDHGKKFLPEFKKWEPI